MGRWITLNPSTLLSTVFIHSPVPRSTILQLKQYLPGQRLQIHQYDDRVFKMSRAQNHRFRRVRHRAR